MKKTIAIIGSAAALSFAGAGLAAAQDVATDDQTQTQTPETTEVDTTAGETTEGETTADDADGTTGDDTTADDTTGDDVDTPEEVSAIASQLCGTISAYDFLGSASGVVPGLSGEECEANADAAVQAAMTGDIAGALDILRGIDAEIPDDGETGDETETADSGSAGLLDGFDGLSAAPEADADADAAPETEAVTAE